MREFHEPLEALAYYTECQFATVEELKDRKRTAKWELHRQQTILDGMLAALRRFGVTPESAVFRRYPSPRVVAALASVERLGRG